MSISEKSISLKQQRMLELLDYQISSCKMCRLHRNGRCKPSWTPTVKYAIIGEAPGADEIMKNNPFIGRAGRLLWDAMAKYGLSRDLFLVINSVNCRPVSGTRNGKPTEVEQQMCYKWLRKYLKVLEPTKALILGEYALFTLTGKKGIMKYNGQTVYSDKFDFPFYVCVHPAYAMYNQEAGPRRLTEGIKSFYEEQ